MNSVPVAADMAVAVANEESTYQKEADSAFYEKGATYWSHIPPTVDGMLGGFGFVSSIDIQGSSNFLKHLFKSQNAPGRARALDCGAGIGRISKYLLLERFEKVDLVEQNPAFLEQASSFIGTNKHLGNMYCSGLQDFTPEPYSYDVIWCQWVLGHLMDEDLIHFLQKCKHGLNKNGVIIAKENVTRDGKSEVDTTDSSITRSLSDLKYVMESAGLKCIRVRRQERFPRMLYPVYILALRPSTSSASGTKRKNIPSEEDTTWDDDPNENLALKTEGEGPCLNNNESPSDVGDSAEGQDRKAAMTAACEVNDCSSGSDHTSQDSAFAQHPTDLNASSS